MAAYRNPRSFSTARRPTHGTASPIRCCYPYTPASPQPSRPAPPNPDHRLVMHPQPLFPNSTPVTRSLPENPTSDLALPSLEHLANALHALARSKNKLPSDRPGRDRRSSHRRPSRAPSATRDRRATRDQPEPEQGAVHVPASTWTFEASSPKTPRRKLHYVPATPSALYSPPPAAMKHISPVPAKETLPTPPPSHASSSPRQLPSSPPKRHYTPAPIEAHASQVPVLAIEAPPTVTPPPATVSKFTRLVLAGRETAADDAAIQALMSSFDRIADSLDCDDDEEGECRSELSID
ncbi:hypothetical protein FRC06_006092 [Ceratobasidium sp. 370]|nr:hypothetical protein FRC06_006092 [Ceratobasidium sp. 370]